ncbi:hypothetical protein HK102_011008 [Quaeritorhiza haematococci]|nr:hypothetical protein HK102_011008 [Quaeritorhiza haematococci]
MGASLATARFSENAEKRPLNNSHPALGYASPDVVKKGGRKKKNVGILESPDGGTRAVVQALETGLNRNFEFTNANLPRSGAVTVTPWPGDYFPTFRDGINFRWDGPNSQSPVEKYARAFGLDPTQLSNSLSQMSGIDSMRSFRPSCTDDSDCANLNDGSMCSKRRGQIQGVCIPGWFGICHAWAPAAILEPEPRCPVQMNGVTFKVMDMKALVTQVYDGANIETVFGGSRCNDPNPAKDGSGRYEDYSCRDLTPDFFHVAVTNMMGTIRSAFIVDVVAADQVWNQGAKIINPSLQTYPFNRLAASLAHVITRFGYIVESQNDGPLVSGGQISAFTATAQYEYLLELDGSGSIIGGEWVGDSKTNHPDFLWFPLNRPSDDTTVAGGITYRNVKSLIATSVNGRC